MGMSTVDWPAEDYSGNIDMILELILSFILYIPTEF